MCFEINKSANFLMPLDFLYSIKTFSKDRGKALTVRETSIMRKNTMIKSVSANSADRQTQM